MSEPNLLQAKFIQMGLFCSLDTAAQFTAALQMDAEIRQGESE